MFHSQCNLIFYVQQRTIKSSNVEMAKINSRNFEKFRICLFLQGQTHSHSDSTGIKIWLPGIFLFLNKVYEKCGPAIKTYQNVV